jgi:putative Mn2+ efflux pump MntP
MILVVLPLGLDTFALSTVVGVLPLGRGQRLRIALVFATAEGLMPAVGLLLGAQVGRALGIWATYVAGAFLLGIGVWMWWNHHQEGGQGKDNENDEAAKITRAVTMSMWSLLGLAVSVSLDELVLGFSFGLLGLPVITLLLLIALQALLVSLLGQWIGKNVGKRIGSYAEQLVGPVLSLLGIWFIVAHLLRIPL